MELAGVEPASKRGSNKLSTCLAPTWFLCKHRIRATHVYLSSFISQEYQSFIPTSLDLLAPPVRAASWQQHPGDVLFRNLVSELSCNLLSSVTQQERNCFRQLWLWSLRFTGQRSKPDMLTYLFYPLSKPVSPVEIVSNWKSENNKTLKSAG